MRRLALLLAVAACGLVLAPAGAVAQTERADARVPYRPPVDGPVVDPFRLPSEPWGAGNRGVDYAPGAGAAVRASADGEVVFAGQVGGQLHVVVLHADGIRTSYSFLRTLAVRRGQRVRRGDSVGTSGDQLHFGARVGDTYIDPRTLFDAGAPEVFLVPDEVRRRGSVAEERSGLDRFLRAGLRAVGAAAGGVADVGQTAVALGREAGRAGANGVTTGVAAQLEELRGIAHYGAQLDPAARAARLVRTTVEWAKQREDCTPAAVRPPPLPERRIAILVAGLGSTSEHDPIDDLDTLALGYGRDDVMRYSYRGGTVDEQPYDGHDTTVDLRTSAKRLRDLLERVHREHPGVSIDLIGHSQGGVVAQTFLAYEYDAGDPRLPHVANLVTLAAPHQGTDIATALAMSARSTTGELAQWGVDAAGLTPFDPRGTSVRQLSETSTFLRKLNRRPLPDGVRATSIGARGDLAVPAGHTRMPRGRNVVVGVPGALADHTGLPGSGAAQREVALALAGMAPTCQSLSDMLTDTAVSDLISTAEDTAGAAMYLGGRWVDARVKAAVPRPGSGA